MREAAGLRTPLGRRPRVAGLVLALAPALLAACSSAADPASSAEETTRTSTPSQSLTISPSPTTSPAPDEPEEPPFRADRKGKQAFVSYVIDGWGYALRTNDPSVLLDASGREPCRGCTPLRRELQQRDKEGWYVQFPGADVRKVSFRRDGEVEVATAVVDIPASQSFFDDGTFRNDNKARRGKKFLIDIRADGRGDRRHWTLVAFSLK